VFERAHCSKENNPPREDRRRPHASPDAGTNPRYRVTNRGSRWRVGRACAHSPLCWSSPSRLAGWMHQKPAART